MIPSSNTVAAAIVLLSVVSQGSCQQSTRTVDIQATAPSDISQKIDPSFPGFAFEESSFYAYSFDAQGKPNSFSQNLVNSVLSRTGGTPLLRVGGTSADYGLFNSSQKDPTNFPPTKSSPPLTDGVTIGPSFFNAFENWPGAKFEFMVPFQNTSYSHTLEWAKTGMRHISNGSLYTLEIGNEPNFYGWFKSGHAAEYVKRYTNLMNELKQSIPILNGPKMFQALDTASGDATALTAKDAFENGLNKIASSIKQVGFHYYQGHGPKTLSELQDWVRHNTSVNKMKDYIPNIEYLKKTDNDVGFALTEVGYNVGGAKGGGKTLDSNLATALWAVDFQLYCMTVNVKRVNWQQILMSTLNMWRAVDSNAGPATVTANFYSQPFIADFISKGGNTQVAKLDVGDDSNGTLTAYAAYESGKLARVALVNLDLWTPQNGTRTYVDFALKGLSGTSKQAKVHYLGAPNGALAKDGLTYAGFQWTKESNGIDQLARNDSSVLGLDGTDVTVRVNATSALMILL
ncbi:uncharacterized protein F4807DRAFT_431319 [Annulohypoxylon truncatum]|uniref:uncharacterized protein n=1 Tax=Annulohypoxylon truncatum TaxID=327061 RepID=UPI0020079EBD|nr:uncharacterized protein F4807DRAFT_431319 [Annulohypoxylon truncatum]KAI1208431.1 hypothetical protein F4807DRAFT_431319 [Annulohypoxylon truncatum]